MYSVFFDWSEQDYISIYYIYKYICIKLHTCEIIERFFEFLQSALLFQESVDEIVGSGWIIEFLVVVVDQFVEISHSVDHA